MQWGNQVGAWTATGGIYYATVPSSSPPTYTSLPTTLADFSFDVDVNKLQDGGVWLRSSTNQNGVLLVTGGHSGTGTGLYWQIVNNGVSSSPINEVTGLFTPGVSNAQLHIVVAGTSYAVYLNGSTTPATTLTTSQFLSGQVALYDNSNQTFDNVSLSPSSSNLDLRDLLGNAYHLTPATYSGGLNESFTISDGPLQPGSYTLTAYGITDRARNPMAAYTYQFSVAAVPPYTPLGRNSHSPGTATAIVTPTSVGDGTVSVFNSYPIGGSSPQYVVSAALRGAGHPLDVVTANSGSGTISVLLGNGDGSFQAPVTYTVGSSPVAVAIGDLNGDGIPDIAVANQSSNTVSILYGNGDGTFQSAVSVTVGSSPDGLAIADLDGQHGNDLVVSNYGGNNVSVLLNKGGGSFATAVNYTVGSNPAGLAIADLNGDGKLDIAVANYISNTVSVLPGNGDGTFGGAVNFNVGSRPYALVAANLNADNKLDLAVANYSSSNVSVLVNQGTPGAAIASGTFAAAVNYNSGGSNPYSLVAADFNGDGKLDLAVANSGNNKVSVLLGNGDGTFQAATAWTLSGSAYPYSLTAGDFNGDGITDLVTANNNASNVSVLLGNAVKLLPVDGTTGLESGYAQGSLTTSTDVDYYSWTGNAGDNVYVAVEVPGNPSSSGLEYQIEDAGGNVLTTFFGNSLGQGQSSPVTLAYTGTYLVKVSPYYNYTGPYRFRVTEAVPPVQVATTFDGSVNSANTPTLANTSPGNLTAQVAGYIGQNDPNGEYYNLGSVPAGTALNLTLSQPATSMLGGVLNVYNSSGVNLTNNVTPGNSLIYTVPSGQSGTYYANVTSVVPQSVGILAQYLLSIDVANITPPQITANTLPAQGTTSRSLINSFTLTFSEGMNAASVNSTANYSLHDSHGNVYAVSLSPNYTSGLTANYTLTNGSLPSGNYTFTVSSAVTDRTGNALPAYTLSFTVFIASPGTATAIVTPTSVGDGTVSVFNSYPIGGSSPQYVVSAALRGAGHPLDVVTANSGSGTISVLLGNGDGSFQAPVTYTVGSSPVAVAIGDLNGDGIPDIAVANQSSNTVSILYGNGDGTFQSAVSVTVGSSPDGLAIADLDGQHGNDLVVSNYGGNNVSVLLNKGGGSFATAVNYTVGSNPAGLAIADLNGDGKLDIAVANYISNTVSVLPGNGDGTFGGAVNFNVGSRPYTLVAANLNADNKLDLAVANYSSSNVSVLVNQGTPGAAIASGTFAAAVNYNSGGSNPYSLVAADFNGDGKLDLAVANSGNNKVSVLLGNGDGTFQAATAWTLSGSAYPYSLTAGDFNGDGITDLVTANNNASNVSVLLGNAVKLLPVDGTTGLESGYAQGSLTTSTDVDYYSWTGNAGDNVYVAVEVPGNPSSSGLEYQIEDAGGNVLTTFFGNSLGQGQSSPVTLAYTGTYLVKVSPYYNYTGPYRFRVTEAVPPVQVATTFDGSVNSANTPTLANTSPGNLTAQVAGYIGQNDPNGEYYNLGSVPAGTALNLTLSQPATSMLGGVLNVYNSSGVNLTNNVTPGNSLIYTVPSGQSGTYYANVTSVVPQSVGILAQYLLSIDVANITPPQITANTLPAQGTTSRSLINSFTLTFSEGMNAASVNSTANYSLHDSHGNVYAVSLSPNYTSGLTANYTLTNGSLPSGNYTFTVSSAVTDRTGNALPAYTLSFTVFIASPGTATAIVTPTSVGDGTVSVFNSYPIGGSSPQYVVSAALRGAGHPLDVVTANSGSGTISVLLGNGDGSFQAPVTYTVGSSPVAVAIGDLNGDGIPDIAVANQSSNTVSILYGNGDGTFQSAVSVTVGSSPDGLAIADLDGQHGNDLVVSNYGGNNVSVLLNKGGGSFATAVNYTVGSNPAGLAIADLNGDGKLDIAVANYISNTVSVLPGNGDGTFGGAVNFNVGSRPYALVAANLNADNKLDLAVANYSSSNVSVLVNQGTPGAAIASGTFAAAVNYNSGGSNPYSLVAADFNGDGKLDLAVANSGNNKVSVLLGNGDGTFQAATAWTLSGSAYPYSLTAGDFNGDGITDLVTANNNASNVSVLLGNAVKLLPVDGTTGLESGYAQGSLTTSTDVDYYSWTGNAGDNVYVAVEVPGNPSSSGLEYQIEDAGGNVLTTFFGNSLGQGQSSPVTLAYTGTYLVKVSPYYNYTGPYRFRVTEAVPPVQVATTFDGSVNSANTPTLANTSPGNLTAQVAGYIGQNDPNGEYYNLGSVPAGTALNLTLSQPATSMLGGVLNVYNSSGVNLTNNVTPGNSLIYTVPSGQSGTYYANVTSVVPQSVGILAQYLLSIDVANITPPQITANTLPAQGTTSRSLINSFTLTFSEGMNAASVNSTANYSLHDSHGNVYAVSLSPNYTSGLTANYTLTNGSLPSGNYTFTVSSAVTDRTGNALPAYTLSFTVFIASPGTATAIVTPTSVGDGTVSVFNSYPIGGSSPQYVVSAALRGAGHPLDVVTANSGSGTISVLLGNGDGSFQAPVTYTVGSSPVAVAIGDLNGDGIPDIAVANQSSNTVSILYGNGDGTFQSAVSVTVGSSPDGLAIADLDGQHGNDLVVSNYGGNNVSVLLNKGGGSFATAVNYTVGSNPAGLAIADLNGDGKLDIAVANYISNTVSVLPGNGDGTFGGAVNFNVGSRPYALVAANLNADNKLDLAVANYSSSNVSVLVNQGTPGAAIASGTFAAAVNYNSGGSNPYSLVAADFNGDGKLDLAVANSGNNKVSVLLGNGDGTFQAATAWTLSGSAYPYSLTAGDFNGDGITDLVTANNNASNVSVLLGNAVKLLPVDGTTGLESGYAQGSLTTSTDVDYYSWTGNAGDNVYVAVEVPGNPSSSGLEYQIEDAGGNVLTTFFGNSLGQGQSSPVTLAYTGTYLVKVSPYYNYTGPYRFRVTEAVPPNQLDKEPNNTIATAQALTLTTNVSGQAGNVAGTLLTSGDLNYFNLGTVQAGQSILLNTYLQTGSALNPVVSVYNASGVYMNKTNGRPFDGVGQIDITTTGTYYALIQNGNSTSGVLDQYVLNVQIVPTSSVALLPNLEVTNISVPTSTGIESGQQITFGWAVTNAGQAVTNVASWSDRVVLSSDSIYGNGDDIQLGVFQHTGALSTGQGYTGTETVTLPDGISGNYYLIIQADSLDQVNESTIGRGDGVTVSGSTFTVSLAPYPDLTVQGLSVQGPSANGTFNVNWNTVNSGNGAVTNNWKEQLVVADLISTAMVTNATFAFTGGVAANGGSVAHSEPATGSYNIDAPVNSKSP